jgi:hypothetical protein
VAGKAFNAKYRQRTNPPSFTQLGLSTGSRLLQGAGGAECTRRSHAVPAPDFRPGLRAHNQGYRDVLGVARARNGGKGQTWGSSILWRRRGPGCCLCRQEEGYLGLQPAVGDEGAGHPSLASLDLRACMLGLVASKPVWCGVVVACGVGCVSRRRWWTKQVQPERHSFRPSHEDLQV